MSPEEVAELPGLLAGPDLSPGQQEGAAVLPDLSPGQQEGAAVLSDLSPGQQEGAAVLPDLSPGQQEGAASGPHLSAPLPASQPPAPARAAEDRLAAVISEVERLAVPAPSEEVQPADVTGM